MTSTHDAYNAGWTAGVHAARLGDENHIPAAPYSDATHVDMWRAGWADGWGATYWHEMCPPDSKNDY